MSSASTGVPPARPWVWSAAQTLTSVPSRGERVSTTQPEPPPSALAHGDELGTPLGERSEVARDRLGQRAGRIAAAAFAQRFEIGLVQQHGVGRDQLLALQAVQAKARRARRIEVGEIAADRVQPADGAAVIVLVMAGDQSGGEPFRRGGLKEIGRAWNGIGFLLLIHSFQRRLALFYRNARENDTDVAFSIYSMIRMHNDQ